MPITVDARRLILREVAADDAAALHALESPEPYWRHLPTEQHDEAAVRDRIARYLEAVRADGTRRRFFWAVELKPDGPVIGEASMFLSAPLIAMIGWGLGERHWSRGLGTELPLALLTFGFGALKLHRIQAEASLDNAASARVMEKIGIRFEGVRRECHHVRGQWW